MAHILLQRAQAEGTPLRDGEQVTFVWRGQTAPQLVGDFNNWEAAQALPLKAVAPGVWARTLKFPRAAYLEYAYLKGNKHVPDPFNPHTIFNGVDAKNHFFYMPAAAPTPLLRREAVPHGVVTKHLVVSTDPLHGTAVGNRRTVYLYQPPTTKPCPLIVVYDGRDYLRRAKLPLIVDNLIAQKRMRPVALALIENGGAAGRRVEYACSESTVGFVLKFVLPFAQARLNLLACRAAPGRYGVLGASLGGLMALYTGLRAPQVFGRVLSQSGAFGVAEWEMVVFELVRASAPKPLKIWLDIGKYDMPELIPGHRRMAKLLQAKGYAVACREYPGGHNYGAWRNAVGRGLEALFGS